MKQMLKEKDVKHAIRTLLQERKIWHFMPAMGQYGRAGIPDFICCINGRLLAIEAKISTGNGTTPLQDIEIERINAAGGVAIVVNENRMFAFEKVLDVMQKSPALGGEVVV